MKQYLLFDLDGTLTDPKIGITTCVQYALKDQGIDEPDLDKLEPFIGPPLWDSFKEFYGMNDEQAQAAVEKYRERFQDVGLFENELYDGIADMLRTLQSKGMYLAVASSKPTVFVERILEHFDIAKYFKVVVGSELDGTRVEKSEVVEEALRQLFGDKPVEYDKVYMIGDRKFDVEGAKALQIESVGVTYGYGGMEELKEAKADYIVRSVEELKEFLLRETVEQTKPKITSFNFIWAMLFPFLMFMFVRSLVQNALSLWAVEQGPTLTGALADFLLIFDETGTLIGLTGNATTIMNGLSFIGGAIAIWGTAKYVIGKTAEDMRLTHLKRESSKNYFLIFVCTVAFVLGLNLLFELLQFTNKSDAYQAVVADQYSANFAIGLICYTLITPVAEELLFRGIIHNYLRRAAAIKVAIVMSSALFSLYHMNAIQGVYGFLMGLLMAYAYEYFGSFMMPVLIHMISNLLAYCLSYTGIAATAFVSWPVCIVCLAIGIVAYNMLNKQKNVY